MNKTFRGVEFDLITQANRAVIDCDFVFTYLDDDDVTELDYDFSAQDGLFLNVYDRKDGKLIKSWTQATGLSLVSNAIRWNEFDADEMDFAKGVYYYEIGYVLDDYTPDDILIVMAYGKHKFL